MDDFDVIDDGRVQWEAEQRAEAEADASIDRMLRMGRWLDRHGEQMLTALRAVRDQWQVEGTLNQTPIVRELAREQAGWWTRVHADLAHLLEDR